MSSLNFVIGVRASKVDIFYDSCIALADMFTYTVYNKFLFAIFGRHWRQVNGSASQFTSTMEIDSHWVLPSIAGEG